MKYFYYISKQKVQMLQAQSRQSGFTLTSLAAKIGFGAASVTASVEKQSETLIAETLALVRALDKSDSLRPLSDLSQLATNDFYHDQGAWQSGLFTFGSWAGPPTVIYALWRISGYSLILLIGSPNNILGEKVVNHDCFVPGTSGAHLAILEYVDKCLRVDEPSAVHVGPPETYGRDIPVPEPTNSPIILPGGLDKREWSQDPNEELEFFPHERGLTLAFLCLRQLRDLHQTNLDTVFRVFSAHEIPGEHETERFCGTNYGREALLEQARELGVFDFNRIYLGSPVYTALQ